ncbi:MAG: helix-turn-helix domain-containing protein [Candidatus Woesearchaeota archaeon]|jgi:sugar-specific transcriptional regulator TrmB
MNSELFKEIGFTQRETKVYLALIELGTTTIGPLTIKTKLQASKVYETLEKLQEKGMSSFVMVSKTKHFQASDPKEILNILDEKKRLFKDIVEELKRKQQSTQTKQTVIVHEGFNAFKSLFNRLADDLDSKDYYFAFAFKNEYHSNATKIFLSNFHNKLKEKKIKDFAIAHTSVKHNIKNTYKSNTNIKIRFTNNETPLGIIIVKDKIINLIWGDRPTAIEITSEQIHTQYKKFFEELWKQSKE